MKAGIGAVAVMLFLSGCTSTYAAARYSISVDNVSYLRAFRGKLVAVGQFTATKPGRSEITCRYGGRIKTQDGESFEQFIRKAFVDELTLAEVYSDRARTTLTGHLEDIDFSSWSSPTQWVITLIVRSSNGKSLTVREEYGYDTEFEGVRACVQTAHALMPAIQNVVRRVVTHADFPALLRD